MLTYENKLDGDIRWALDEGGRYFQRESAVHLAARRLADAFEQLDIRYAVTGALAMFFHGYRRFTEDVDLVVDGDDLKRVTDEVPDVCEASQSIGRSRVRDGMTGVRIDLYAADASAGRDERPAVAIDLDDDARTIDGLNVLRLEKLVESKIALGVRSRRMRHLADVQQMIILLDLPLDLMDDADAAVKHGYRETWDAAQLQRASDEAMGQGFSTVLKERQMLGWST